MGIELQHPPKYWRMRAEEFRAKADSCEHAQARESLRKVAKAYDQLARSAEQIQTVQQYAGDQRAVAEKLRRKMN